MVVDLYLVYSFIRRLATPFEKWPAYELGIIDEDGNILKKRKDLLTIKERNAFGIFDVMILNLKKLLAKVPGGKSRIASYAAALYLIREWNHFSDSSMLIEDLSDKHIEESIDLFYDRYVNYNILSEDVNPLNESEVIILEKLKASDSMKDWIDDFYKSDAPQFKGKSKAKRRRMAIAAKLSAEKQNESAIEETPTVNAGSGAIAGIGVGPQGEPGLTPSQMKRYKKKNKVQKRLRDIIGVKP